MGPASREHRGHRRREGSAAAAKAPVAAPARTAVARRHRCAFPRGERAPDRRERIRWPPARAWCAVALQLTAVAARTATVPEERSRRAACRGASTPGAAISRMGRQGFQTTRSAPGSQRDALPAPASLPRAARVSISVVVPAVRLAATPRCGVEPGPLASFPSAGEHPVRRRLRHCRPGRQPSAQRAHGARPAFRGTVRKGWAAAPGAAPPDPRPRLPSDGHPGRRHRRRLGRARWERGHRGFRAATRPQAFLQEAARVGQEGAAGRRFARALLPWRSVQTGASGGRGRPAVRSDGGAPSRAMALERAVPSPTPRSRDPLVLAVVLRAEGRRRQAVRGVGGERLPGRWARPQAVPARSPQRASRQTAARAPRQSRCLLAMRGPPQRRVRQWPACPAADRAVWPPAPPEPVAQKPPRHAISAVSRPARVALADAPRSPAAPGLLPRAPSTPRQPPRGLPLRLRCVPAPPPGR